MEYSKMVDGVRVPMTEDEIAARQAEEAEALLPKPKPLDQQLDEIIDELPMETQVQFATLIATGKVFIDTKRLDRLKALVESVELPLDLEPVREAMLEKLNEY